MQTSRAPLIFAAVSLLAGIAAGAAGYHAIADAARARCERAQPHLNAAVLCGREDVIRKTSYADTKREVEHRIGAGKASGVTSASVYFRDLVHGPVFGLSELAPFAPASLLKLPTALVFMNAAEQQDGVLGARIRYQGTALVGEQRIPPKESATEGETYAITDLLRMMLTYSDNASYQALDAFLRAEPQRVELRKETFQELGLLDPETRTETTLSVRGYASLFTLLFNASYLDAGGSEQVLSWLSDSTYRDGLVAGVPASVTVAHKFGERIRPDDTKELHDCGIIYYPGNPYLLCVMTRGDDWGALTALIADISRTVYQEVDSRRL